MADKVKPERPLRKGDKVTLDVRYNGSVSKLRGVILQIHGTSADVQLDGGVRSRPFTSSLKRESKAK